MADFDGEARASEILSNWDKKWKFPLVDNPEARADLTQRLFDFLEQFFVFQDELELESVKESGRSDPDLEEMIKQGHLIRTGYE